MMKKQDYATKLKSPHWQKKRLDILKRDNYTCQQCGEKERTLHVHHIRYEYGKDPWDYDNRNFMTLCDTCHEIEESFRTDVRGMIYDFYSMGISAERIYDFLMYGHGVDFKIPE